jgi:hypothetical protein
VLRILFLLRHAFLHVAARTQCLATNFDPQAATMRSLRPRSAVRCYGAASAANPKFASSVLQRVANFGTGTRALTRAYRRGRDKPAPAPPNRG